MINGPPAGPQAPDSRGGGDPLSYRSPMYLIQRAKTLAANPNDLNLIPRTHMVERENEFLNVVL